MKKLNPHHANVRKPEIRAILGDGRFMLYNTAVLLNTIGLVYPLLIPLRGTQLLQQAWVAPVLYLLIQLVDAPTALLAGRAFDRHGLKILYLPILLSIFPSLATVLTSEVSLLVAASLVFGVVLGMQESVYRSAVAVVTSEEHRATAYGLFGAFYGLGLVGSGALFGYFLESLPDPLLIISIVILLQTAAVLLLRRVSRES